LSHSYGYIPDLPDHRDHLYAAPLDQIHALPSSVDLRPGCPVVYDQGPLGSCTANAIAAAIQFDRMKQGLPDFTPSRLFIYYNERAMEGTIDYDSGAMIRDGVKSVNRQGACSEPEWPYYIDSFRDRPSDLCYQQAQLDRAVGYQRVTRDLTQIRACLASGFPMIFGFTVYESFESSQVARDGIVPMPHRKERVLGGHAVLAVGYDDGPKRFIIRNSWGPEWAVKGYCTMPYEYLTNRGLSSDFWTIRTVG
jgi:C1A family cysteine protease